MNTLGSHPGAILFRFSVMVILILILIVVFLRYIEDSRRGFEEASILRTKEVIDSSLAVVFAEAAINQQLNDLSLIQGGNPFELMQRHEILHSNYLGVLERDLSKDDLPGWYFLSHRGKVAYKAHYLERDSYFEVILKYDDKNRSGRFEADADKFRNLQFVRIAGI